MNLRSFVAKRLGLHTDRDLEAIADMEWHRGHARGRESAQIVAAPVPFVPPAREDETASPEIKGYHHFVWRTAAARDAEFRRVCGTPLLSRYASETPTAHPVKGMPFRASDAANKD